MKKTLSLLLFALVFSTLSSFAQKKMVKGIVVDNDTQEPLIGVTIFDLETKKGTTTDLDGSFNLKVAEGAMLRVSYIGYIPKEVTSKPNMGTISLESSALGLKQIEVTASVAVRRKTPVAVSVINAEQLETKLGTQEFPEILKSTPGIYATKQGGGFGDSRVNLRGFESANVAIMVNGVPMNDMEWGGVYWSNWTGLTDVTRSLQVQRGLGASKVAAPSIGGSINVVTRSTDAKKGGSVYYGIGNDGYNKAMVNVSTGLLDNGWAMTFLGSKNVGDGYIQGTDYTAYSWFVNVSKMINENHSLSLTAFSSPQVHSQRNRNDKLLVSEWQNAPNGYKYNASYGYDINGQPIIASENHYNKPQISLNHYWTMNEKSSLSTALYLSIGKGGGTAWRGKQASDMYGTDSSTGKPKSTYRNIDGTRDYATVQRENAESDLGSNVVLTESRNNHIWTGLLSTYTTKLSDNIDFYGGVDLRYYEGLHDAYVTNLMGGQFFIDPSRASAKNKSTDPLFVNQKLGVGDNVYRDYTAYVVQEGVFGQAEYNKDALSAFLSGAVSNNSYWKVDRFYYNNAKSETGNFLGYNLKGGANYNLNNQHNVFANIGYMSRAPFMSGGYFTNITTSNDVNPNAVNEKSYTVEAGYGFRSKYFTANLNAYYTKWIDRTMTARSADDQDAYYNLRGVDARHQGIELEIKSEPIKNFYLTGMLSLGDWEWVSSASGYAYTRDGQPVLDKNGNQQEITVDLEGVKVGNSAQTTAALGASYKLFNSLTVGADYTFYADNYADYRIVASSKTYYTPWKIPSAGVLDLNANYKFKIGTLDATLFGNVNNVLNQEYITDAQMLTSENRAYTEEDVSVFYGFLRTWSVGLKIRF